MQRAIFEGRTTGGGRHTANIHVTGTATKTRRTRNERLALRVFVRGSIAYDSFRQISKGSSFPNFRSTADAVLVRTIAASLFTSLQCVGEMSWIREGCSDNLKDGRTPSETSKARMRRMQKLPKTICSSRKPLSEGGRLTALKREDVREAWEMPATLTTLRGDEYMTDAPWLREPVRRTDFVGNAGRRASA